MIKRCQGNPYEGGEIPPCSAFLGNEEPIIKDGNIIFRNENRAYYFISAVPDPNNQQTPSTEDVSNCQPPENPTINFNLQVSLATYIIGLFINKIQRGQIKYDENLPIHADQTANNLIHQILKKSPQVKTDYIPQLSLVISNGNAILPLYTYTININPLIFYILFLLNRFEDNPGLFFGNNSFATEDMINFNLAALNIWFPEL